MGTHIFWSDAFLLGFAPMDDTHREFVALVEALLAAPDVDVSRLMAEFERHAETHFGQEAVWMEESGFPAKDCHMQEHEAVLKSIREVRALVNTGNVEIARRLGRELAAWFPAHADYMDSALAQWMVKKRLGGAPVVLKRSVVPDALR